MGHGDQSCQCKVIKVTSSWVPFNVPGGCLQRQTLRVDISSNLSWNIHVDRITATASRSLGFMKPNVITRYPQTREMAYQSFVRPELEFASAVWDPHIKDIKWSKDVQPGGH